MPATVDIKAEALEAILRRAADRAGDLSPLMALLADEWLERTQERMLRGEQPDGRPQPPRSPVTIARYVAEGKRFGPPLIVTRDLQSQISAQSTPRSAEIGSNAIQAAVMQFGARQGAFGRTARGGPIPWGDIPARPFIGMGEADEAALILTAEEWLEATIGTT